MNDEDVTQLMCLAGSMVVGIACLVGLDQMMNEEKPAQLKPLQDILVQPETIEDAKFREMK